MNETLILLLAGMGGGILGAIYFGGLWWTVRQGLSSEQPALWFLGSMLLRMSITLVGFYFIAHAHWERFLLCLFGFVMARFVLMRLTRTAEKQIDLAQEASHAP
ncbi:MAG: ATP synthase subunit I [Proteobacteria bacterium]|nr:ATP synthase subunit I [Pseudomonadota bacterium]MBU1650118.1 ATP synthase subunit I [Pseudomonadota bacterium]